MQKQLVSFPELPIKTKSSIALVLLLVAVAQPALAQDYPAPDPEPGYAPPPPSDPDYEAPDGGDDDDDDDDDGGGTSELLPPSTRPMWFVVGGGPTFYGLAGKAKTKIKGGVPTRGRLGLDFGYHLSGDAEGPAIGATIEQSFGKGFYMFNPAFKFWWDIHITDMAIYVTPFGKAGYALVTEPIGHAVNIGLGVEGRVVFKDRWMTFLRPVQVDTFIGDFFDETFVLSYVILIGGGVTF